MLYHTEAKNEQIKLVEENKWEFIHKGKIEVNGRNSTWRK
jgi:hypothetical protein